MGSSWHFRHFSCFICDTNLTTQMTYVPRENKCVQGCPRSYVLLSWRVCAEAFSAERCLCAGGRQHSIPAASHRSLTYPCALSCTTHTYTHMYARIFTHILYILTPQACSLHPSTNPHDTHSRPRVAPLCRCIAGRSAPPATPSTWRTSALCVTRGSTPRPDMAARYHSFADMLQFFVVAVLTTLPS